MDVKGRLKKIGKMAPHELHVREAVKGLAKSLAKPHQEDAMADLKEAVGMLEQAARRRQEVAERIGAIVHGGK